MLPTLVTDLCLSCHLKFVPVVSRLEKSLMPSNASCTLCMVGWAMFTVVSLLVVSFVHLHVSTSPLS